MPATRVTIGDQGAKQSPAEDAEQPPTGGMEQPPTGGGDQPQSQGEPVDDGDDPRRVAHELLSQAHAVLVITMREDVLVYWCPENLRESFRDTRIPLSLKVGEIQVEIGSGRQDADLLVNGIGGAVSRHKRKGLRASLERLIGVLRTNDGDGIRAWIRSAAGLARTAIGSLAREIPGGEFIAEALDGVLSGLDTWEAQTRTNPNPGGEPTTPL